MSDDQAGMPPTAEATTTQGSAAEHVPAYEQPPAGSPSGPVAQAPTPRRRRRWSWILGALLVVCLVVGGLFAYTKIQDKRVLEVYERVAEELAGSGETIGTESGMLESSLLDDSDGFKAAREELKGIGSQTTTMREDLAHAREQIEPLRPSQARSATLASIDAQEDACDEVDALVAEADSMLDAAGRMIDFTERLDEPNRLALAALDAANDEKWSVAEKKSAQASEGFAALIAEAKSLHEDAPELGMDDFAALLTLKKEQSEEVGAIARAGKARNISKYNAAVKSFNSYNTKILDADSPDIVSDPMAMVEPVMDRLDALMSALDRWSEAASQAEDAIADGEY